MQNKGENSIEDILLKAGLISYDKLKSIKDYASESGKDIERILLEEGVTNYKEILKFKAKKINVDFVDLENITVDKDAIRTLSPEIAKKYMVFPFKIQDNLLFLAMQNPDDIFQIDEIKVFTQMEIKPFLADSRLINRAVNYFYINTGKDEVDKTDKTFKDKNEVNNKHTLSEYKEVSSSISLSKQVSVKDFIDSTIKKSLIPENITNIAIDTDKRNITVTLNIKY